MPGFQPKIMIVNGLHQDGGYPRPVCPQGVRIDLVPGQGRLLRRNAEPAQALPDAPEKRLFCPGDTGNVVFPAKGRYSVPLAVGDHADGDAGAFHRFQPPGHRFRWDIGGIGDDGIVKVQHEKPNAQTFQQVRRKGGEGRCHHLGQQGKGHIRRTPFIGFLIHAFRAYRVNAAAREIGI